MKRTLFAVFLLLSTTLCYADIAQDVVTGNGSSGPYTLSWKGIASSTEKVQVGALPQTRGIDYVLDTDAGAITFMHSIPVTGVASVRYEYDPAHAVRTGAAPVIPLAVDLVRAGPSSLALSACLRPGDVGTSGASEPLSVGIQGGLHSVNGSMAAQIVYAPAINNSDAVTAGVSASLAPVKTVALNAGITLSQQGEQDMRRQTVNMTLTSSSVLSLNAGIGARNAGATGFTFTTLGAVVHPAHGLEVAGTYTGRVADPTDTADNMDSTAAQVALAPFGAAVRLTGTYAQNPDNGGDFAQHLAQRGLGLETRVGALNLSGGYNWTRDLSVPEDESGGTSLTVNMELRLSGATQLTGGCTQTLQELAASPGTNLYTLGLSHAVGNSVSLSLSGSMQAPVNAIQPISPGYTANASLGLKF